MAHVMEHPDTTNPTAFDPYSANDIFLLTSLTSGSSAIITATSRLEHLLKSHKIPFKPVDLATDARARRIWSSKGNGRRLPGVARDGEILGNFEELEEWNEYGELKQRLGIKKTKKKKKKADGENKEKEKNVMDGSTSGPAAMVGSKPNAEVMVTPDGSAGGSGAVVAAAAAAVAAGMKKGKGLKSAVEGVEGKRETRPVVEIRGDLDVEVETTVGDGESIEKGKEVAKEDIRAEVPVQVAETVSKEKIAEQKEELKPELTIAEGKVLGKGELKLELEEAAEGEGLKLELKETTEKDVLKSESVAEEKFIENVGPEPRTEEVVEKAEPGVEIVSGVEVIAKENPIITETFPEEKVVGKDGPKPEAEKPVKTRELKTPGEPETTEELMAQPKKVKEVATERHETIGEPEEEKVLEKGEPITETKLGENPAESGEEDVEPEPEERVEPKGENIGAEEVKEETEPKPVAKVEGTKEEVKALGSEEKVGGAKEVGASDPEPEKITIEEAKEVVVSEPAEPKVEEAEMENVAVAEEPKVEEIEDQKPIKEIKEEKPAGTEKHKVKETKKEKAPGQSGPKEVRVGAKTSRSPTLKEEPAFSKSTASEPVETTLIPTEAPKPAEASKAAELQRPRSEPTDTPTLDSPRPKEKSAIEITEQALEKGKSTHPTLTETAIQKNLLPIMNSLKTLPFLQDTNSPTPPSPAVRSQE
ncbi:hypothetical protein HOY82DRAFT_608240 [Tuber indicum]|nr:hypothetical protein HOY82DRAFT_608240 [Tuber indicum]